VPLPFGELAGAFGTARCWPFADARGRAWFRPYLENCTVDASIFFLEVCL
jgi:hypothetical protein